MKLLFFISCALISHGSSVFSFPLIKNSSTSLPSWKNMVKNVKIFMQNINEMSTVSQKSTVTSEFCRILENGPIKTSDRIFLINGWRWHTISVLRDLDRFKSLTQTKTLTDEQLLKCYDHVFNFNWNALIRVEKDIFFPWLTTILPDSSKDMMVTIVEKHNNIYSLSKKLKSYCSSSQVFHKNQANVQNIINDLNDCAISIQNTQENYLVPYITAYISKKEQNKFNRKVLSSLGLLNSQIHLVSMFEAIKDNPKEMKIFNTQMPSVARALIPVWRSNFYTPRTSCFEAHHQLPVTVKSG